MFFAVFFAWPISISNNNGFRLENFARKQKNPRFAYGKKLEIYWSLICVTFVISCGSFALKLSTDRQRAIKNMIWSSDTRVFLISIWMERVEVHKYTLLFYSLLLLDRIKSNDRWANYAKKKLYHHHNNNEKAFKHRWNG